MATCDAEAAPIIAPMIAVYQIKTQRYDVVPLPYRVSTPLKLSFAPLENAGNMPAVSGSTTINLPPNSLQPLPGIPTLHPQYNRNSGGRSQCDDWPAARCRSRGCAAARAMRGPVPASG